MFRELYYAEPSDDQGNPFGIEAIEKCLGPVSAEPVAVWGWDLAKYQDWTVGVGLDASGRVSVFERFQRPWEETVSAIRGLVGGTPALIDSTGVGDPIVERLQRTLPNVQGFLFSPTSKQRLMEGLAVAIQHEEISYPDGPIAQELRDFEFAYTRTGGRYSAPEGAHDDCVCGLALARSRCDRRRSRCRGCRWKKRNRQYRRNPCFMRLEGCNGTNEHHRLSSDKRDSPSW